MKRNEVLPLVLLASFIIFAIGSVMALRFLSGPEDTWICSRGQWVKHGNPIALKPITPCSR